MKRLAALAVAAVLAAACAGSGDRVVVAAGTTLVDSGIVDALAAAYEATDPGVAISVVGRATAEVLELGAQGAADVLITHAPLQERAFLADHEAATSWPLFTSRFVVVGPAGRVAGLAGLTGPEAFRRIAVNGWRFVSRADGSGTYERETALWAEAGVDPSDAPWYVETGQGMGPSLQVADQRGAFILVEEGTLLSAGDSVRLAVAALEGSDRELVNAYTLLLPRPGGPAEALAQWLLSPAGRAALAAADTALFGRAVYVAASPG